MKRWVLIVFLVIGYTTGLGLIRFEVVHATELKDTFANASIAKHPDPPPSCQALTAFQSMRIARALALMRQTKDGQLLYQVMVYNHICLGVKKLPDSIGAISLNSRDASNNFIFGNIYLNSTDIDSREPDRIISAILVHEATHQLKAIDKTDCKAVGGCHVSTNGQVLDNEVPAYASEAEWWYQMYGLAGPPNPDQWDRGETQLMLTYKQNPAYFRTYIQKHIGA